MKTANGVFCGHQRDHFSTWFHASCPRVLKLLPSHLSKCLRLSAINIAIAPLVLSIVVFQGSEAGVFWTAASGSPAAEGRPQKGTPEMPDVQTRRSFCSDA